ncbi:hypothetical protein AB0O52_14080 [Arthrobacter sp. NPDC080073]|uniref:hypothetical protein n=1 Tax=Arthrobacter sp. NPDC080073 TaxID=3155919 RepID=UPI00342F8052
MLEVQSVDLSGLDFPPTAEVAVEAYRQTTKVRIPCGSIGSPNYPEAVHLSAFDIIENVQLRLRVVGTESGSHGKVLAVADRLLGAGSRDEDSAEPLLKLQRAELGERVWRFGIDGDQPILYINKFLENHDQLVHSAAFKALVLPEFFRQVALWIARNRDDADEPNSTISHWLLFCDSIGVDPSDLDSSEEGDSGIADIIDEWATEAASVFADHIGALSLLNSPIDLEEEDDNG